MAGFYPSKSATFKPAGGGMRVETFLWYCPLWAMAFGLWLYICRFKTEAKKIWKYAAIAYVIAMAIFWKTTTFFVLGTFYGFYLAITGQSLG